MDVDSPVTSHVTVHKCNIFISAHNLFSMPMAHQQLPSLSKTTWGVLNKRVLLHLLNLLLVLQLVSPLNLKHHSNNSSVVLKKGPVLLASLGTLIAEH